MLDLSTIPDERIYAESSRRQRLAERRRKFTEACYTLIRGFFNDEHAETRHAAENGLKAFAETVLDFAEDTLAEFETMLTEDVAFLETKAEYERRRQLLTPPVKLSELGEHTPGPWSVMWQNLTQREYGGGITHWEVPIQVGARGNAGNVLAVVSMGGPGACSMDRDSVSANARLIAAAPRLLEALKQLLRLWTTAPNDAAPIEFWLNEAELTINEATTGPRTDAAELPTGAIDGNG